MEALKELKLVAVKACIVVKILLASIVHRVHTSDLIIASHLLSPNPA